MRSLNHDSITAFYDGLRMLHSNPDYLARRDARLNADGEAYRREKRLKAVKRYLRERAARGS